MTDFVFDNLPVPETKSDKNPLPGGADHTQFWRAADANAVEGDLASLRNGITSAMWHRWISNPSAPLSDSGSVVSRSNAGRFQASENGGPFLSVGATRVNVKDYGAVADGATDDGPAFSAAIAAAVSTGKRTVYVPEGQYYIGTSINGTGIGAGFNLVGGGIESQLKGHCTAKPMIDLVGSVGVHIESLWIQGDGTNMPSVGILTGRTTGDAFSGSHTFKDLTVTGSFSIGAYVGTSSETNVHSNCSYQNFKVGANVAAVVANNLWVSSNFQYSGQPALTSNYIAISPTPVGGNTTHFFHACQLIANGGGGDTTSTVLYLQDVQGLSFAGFMAGYGAYGVRFASDCSDVTFAGSTRDELTTTYGFYLGTSVTVDKLHLTAYVSSAPFYGDTSSVLQNSHVQGAFGNISGGGDAGFQMALDSAKRSTIDLVNQGLKVRATYEDCIRLGDSHSDSMPSATRGVVRYETITDPGGSGHTIHVRHIHDEQPYDDRLYTKVLNSPAIQQRPLYVASQSGAYTPNLWNAAYYYFGVTGDASFSNASAGPVGNSGVAQDGAILTVQVAQDSTGYHAWTWGSNYHGVSRIIPKQGPNQVTTFTFVLSVSGAYELVSHDGIDIDYAINVRNFGAKGDGLTDDTAAFKKMFAYFSANTSTGGDPPRSGEIYIPGGLYHISDVIECVGNPSFALKVRGTGQGQDGTGSQIIWTGTGVGEERVFHFMGCCNLVLEDFEVDCQALAKYGIQIDSFNRTFPTIAGSTQCVYNRVTVGNTRAVDGCATWLVGYIPAECAGADGDGLQIDDQQWNSCNGGQPLSGDTYDIAHVRVLQPGNTKNFAFYQCQFLGGRFGLHGAYLDGTCVVESCTFGDLKGNDTTPFMTCGAAVYSMGQHVTVRNCAMEGDTARFIGDSLGVTLPCSYHISDCYWAANLPADGYCMALSGSVYVENSDFYSDSGALANVYAGIACSPSSSSVDGYNIHLKNVGVSGPSSGSGSMSLSNTFPLYDSSGNHLTMDEYAIYTAAARVCIEDCYLMDSSNNPIRNLVGAMRLGEVIPAKLGVSQPAFWSTGQTVPLNGYPAGVFMRKETWGHSGFTTANEEAQRSTLLPIPVGAKGIQLVKAEILVTTPFVTSDANNVYLSLGTTNPGGEELLKKTLVSGVTAGFAIGRATADVGTDFTSAAFGRPTYVAGGGTTTYVTCWVDAGHGGLAALTAGAFEIRYFYEIVW